MNRIIILLILSVLCIIMESCSTSAESVKPESDKADKKTIADNSYNCFLFNIKDSQL
jgi:hypothetical protein